MIVPMKKAVIVVQAKDSRDCLDKLRFLGVLHIEHAQAPRSNDISLLIEEASLAEQAVNILSGVKISRQASIKERKSPEGKFVSQHIIDLCKRKDQLSQYLVSLSIQIKQYAKWGDFDPRAFAALAEKNIFAGIYQIPCRQIKQIAENIAVNILSSKGGIANCLLVSDRKMNIGFKEISLPSMSLAQMRERREHDLQAIRHLEEQLAQQLVYLQGLKENLAELRRKLEFQQAFAGMGQAEELVYICGYIPFDKTHALSCQAKQSQWAITVTEPRETDIVPTLIRNPRWISLASPVFKFLEVTPEYREWDISPVFIFFFSLFFGMLIGDAGYGIVYMLLTFWAQKKSGGKARCCPVPAINLTDGEKTQKRDSPALFQKEAGSVFFLFYLLSLCAIIWGLLTGTFFGQDWFLKIGYKPLVPALNNLNSIQAFCFFVGALHLSVAHIWRAVIKLPSAAFLAEVGWICVIWSVFLLAKMLILGDAFPAFGRGLIITGVSLVVLFNNPQKNIFKIFNVDLITLALGLISSFGEVVSYIRLFAVGLAGVAIADAFNAMAAGIGFGSAKAILASVFVIMLGHILCLVLGPLSVLVHGIRLNLLEFSGHANISWSGVAYKPFKE